jgi:hypothetical protein
VETVGGPVDRNCLMLLFMYCPVPKHKPGGSKILQGQYSVSAFRNTDIMYKK